MRNCATCDTDITGRHGNSLRCKPCATEAKLIRVRECRPNACVICKTDISALHGLKKACPRCASELVRLRAKRRVRPKKQRACVTCGRAIMADHSRQRCDGCRAERARARCRSASRAWAQRHPDRAKAARAKTYKNDGRRKARAYRDSKPEVMAKAKLTKKQWREKNPLRDRLSNQRRRARLRDSSSPGVTAEQWAVTCALHNDRCAYCFVETRLTIDHFIPISAGGRDAPDNVVPACLRCNISKNNRPFLLWFADRGHEFMESPCR